MLPFPMIIFSISVLFLNPIKVYAYTMSNDQLILQMGNINSSTRPQNAMPTESEVSGQNQVLGNNYTISFGLSSNTKQSLTFNFSNPVIDFGPLSGINPITRTATFSITSLFPSEVMAQEDHELVNQNGDKIPDTTCDNGTCSEDSGSTWTSALTYGFGFRCDNLMGNLCASLFQTANTFSQFANQEKAEQEEILAKTNGSRIMQKGQITYELNISGTQPKGIYENTISYIAMPEY